MAPPHDRDTDPEKPPSKPENPFIRFRQFADSQISSLLQGIVGLPSAISKSPSSNARWAEFDEKLQRRDELKQSQNQYNQEEASEEEPDEADDEVEIPVRKYPGRRNYAHSEDDRGEYGQRMEDGTDRDLPLYSPASKSLLAHLDRTYDDTQGWLLAGPRLSSLIPGEYTPIQMSIDRMRELRFMTLRQLSASSNFQSDYSLLPYLLFSPYSPLKLSSQQASPTKQHDSFPFCDAFEDLIRVSQDRPMATVWTRVGLQDPWPFHHPTPYAASCMEWIKQLQSNGLLQQSTDLHKVHMDNLRDRIRQAEMAVGRHPPSLGLPHPQWNHQDRDLSSSSPKKGEPETEQDMYERLSPSAAGLERMIDFLCADLDKRFEAFDRPSRPFPEAERASAAPENPPSAETVGQRAASFNPNKIVATSTTTERTENEDGSVNTTILVQKRFADGRETITTTTQTAGGGSSERHSSTKEVGGGHEEKKQEKRGWFWN